MKLMIHDPYQEDMFFTKLNVERRGFEEVLCSSDILTLHVPLTRRTRHILNKTTLELMPSGTTVINVSRGQVVCEDSLYGALMSGQIWAAGLDVYEKEPVAKSARLLTLPQVVTTPHIGANTFEAFRRASEHAVEKILVFLRSGESSDLLPPTSAWWTEDNA
jgi:D-3-phosphoglycerate dehydrogenase